MVIALEGGIEQPYARSSPSSPPAPSPPSKPGGEGGPSVFSLSRTFLCQSPGAKGAKRLWGGIKH